ncbi:hypothetical protein OG233_18400 [Streptomyces sp. NBC_01218]|uniref:hypothetical protein n=1 Tax=unclassified Streptomyces TaxID=2593676 RepID=UPI002E1248E7|nr:hypothetical protein OG233_18400 [Streptomyces sp. NBC_01218]
MRRGSGAGARTRSRTCHPRDSPYTTEEWEETHTHLLRISDVMGEMPAAMRKDLGVAASPGR